MKKKNNEKPIEKRDRRISVCFSDPEFKAIEKKAFSHGVKPSSAIRLMALKNIGHIQLSLFDK